MIRARQSVQLSGGLELEKWTSVDLCLGPFLLRTRAPIRTDLGGLLAGVCATTSPAKLLCCSFFLANGKALQYLLVVLLVLLKARRLTAGPLRPWTIQCRLLETYRYLLRHA